MPKYRKPPRRTLRRRIFEQLWKVNHEHGAHIDRMTAAVMVEVNLALRKLHEAGRDRRAGRKSPGPGYNVDQEHPFAAENAAKARDDFLK
jgi:hypothetical protein